MTVLGGGMAGLSAALLLARDGHRVRVLERDRVEAAGEALDAPGWERRGVAHFLQPHGFIPRGRVEMMAHLPDVYEALLAAGARDVDVRPKMPASPSQAGDEDLQYLTVRRPLIEWALRRAVQAEQGIEVRDGVKVEGLVVEHGRVAGVRVDGSVLDMAGGLVVDALGRRTPTPQWLADADSGVGEEPAETSDCGVVYYSRYYRQRPGFDLPDGPWVLSPRGDLGYCGFSTFIGDNRTFAGLLAVPNHVPEWRVLSDVDVFEAAIARIPLLHRWTDPAGVEPLTGVLPMAGLHNSLRSWDPGTGLVPVGDAASHSDPVLAHGLSFAIIHAIELSAALREHGSDHVAAASAYAQRTSPALRERYQLASDLDDQRRRLWTGEAVDFAHHDGAYALFSLVAAGACAPMDADVFRAFVRRMGLLDSTSVLDDDLDLQLRIEELFAAARAMPRPPAGPATRDELLAGASS